MTRYFPEVVAAVRANFPERAVIDGEIVVVDRERNRLDFEVLQQRIHPAASRVKLLAEQTPASFVAFDLLALGDEDLTGHPFAERRARLAFDEIMATAIELGGTITGEHGVGRLKIGSLEAQLGPDVMALTRRVKAALDPHGILNPGAGF